jgi:hypothetical protein
MRPRLAPSLVTYLLGVLPAAPAALAQTVPAERAARVVVEVTGCESVPITAVRHILGIEVGDLLAPAEAKSVSASDRLTIRCVGNLAWIEASSADGAGPVDRTVSLADFPGDAAARALALAGLELLASRSPTVRARLRAKRAPAKTTEVAPIAPSAAPVTGPSPKPPAQELRVGLAGTWRSFLADQGVSAWGGQALVERDLARWWQLHADLELASARRTVPLGEARALLLSCGATVGAHTGGASLGVAVALGARLGFARLAGSASDQATTRAATATRPWGGPIVSASVHGGIGPFALILAAEAGRSLGKVTGTADDAPALVIHDTWVAISLGGALRR